MSIQIPLSRLDDSPFQDRLQYDEEYVAELASNIKINGLLQAPVARIVDELGEVADVGDLTLTVILEVDRLLSFRTFWRVQIAFGHNRLRAFRKLADEDAATWGSMPIDLRQLTDEQMSSHTWTENYKRRELNPLEEARAIERRMKHFGWSQQKVAEHLDLARSTVSNKLRLLQLPEDILAKLGDGTLAERQAMALLRIETVPEEIKKRLEVEHAWDHSGGGYGGQRPRIEIARRAALAGESSDTIRDVVEQQIASVTEDLKVDVERSFEDERVRNNTCKGCPFHFWSRNQHRCGDPACHGLKQTLVHLEVLTPAAEASGIPVLEGASSAEWSAFSGYNDEERKAISKVKVKGCPTGNARLAYSEHTYSKHDRVTGHDHAQIVCQHGVDGKCQCLLAQLSKKRSAKAVEVQDTKSGRAAARLVAADVYVQPAIEALTERLLALDGSAWWGALLEIERNLVFNRVEAKGERTFETLVHAAVLYVFDQKRIWSWQDPTLADVRKGVEGRLEACGIEYPWNAEDFQASRFGEIDMLLLAELASVSTSAVSELIAQANVATLRAAIEKVSENGKPKHGHKARVELITARIAEMESGTLLGSDPPTNGQAHPEKEADPKEDEHEPVQNPMSFRARLDDLTAFLQDDDVVPPARPSDTLAALKRLEKDVNRRQTELTGQKGAANERKQLGQLIGDIRRTRNRLSRKPAEASVATA